MMGTIKGGPWMVLILSLSVILSIIPCTQRVTLKEEKAWGWMRTAKVWKLANQNVGGGKEKSQWGQSRWGVGGQGGKANLVVWGMKSAIVCMSGQPDRYYRVAALNHRCPNRSHRMHMFFYGMKKKMCCTVFGLLTTVFPTDVNIHASKCVVTI